MSEPSAKMCSTDRYTQKLGHQQNVMQHGQIYFSITATLKVESVGLWRWAQKVSVSKNVTQQGQIYPKTGRSAKM